MAKKIYVGFKSGSREVFKTSEEVTEDTFNYNSVVGPFRTLRGANFYMKNGIGNPHVRCVADAERIALEISNR